MLFRSVSKTVKGGRIMKFAALVVVGDGKGIQSLPGSKMASAGQDWRDNASTQIKWGLDYILQRYKTPCGAWAVWQTRNWY